MRVAHVSPSFYPFAGGVETHVQMLCEHLQSRGLEVQVLTTDSTWRLPQHSVVNGITVRRFKSFAPRGSYHFSPELYSYLKKSFADYDLVHTHSYHSLTSLSAALTKSRCPLVFTPHYHGTGHTWFRSLLHVPYGRIGKLIVDKSDSIICVSSYEMSLLSARFPEARDKITIIPNGIDQDEFANLERPSVSSGDIVYLGRLERYKRVDCIIRAIPFLQGNLRLVIIGSGPDRERLERIVSKLSLGNRVSFAGYLPREELLNKIVNAKALVNLSAHEAYGITIAEALSLGVPSVVSTDSALVEFASHANCIPVAAAENPFEVASAISKASLRGISHAEFPSWGEVARETLRLYSGVALHPAS